ncbi:protein phosphatase 2C [Tanacetum coccineum]
MGSKTVSNEDSTLNQANLVKVPLVVANSVSLLIFEKNHSKGVKSVYELEYIPLWGCESVIGKRPEMEDAVAVVPRFMEVPIKMFVGDHVVDGVNSSLTSLTTHFFGVYDGHGGSQARPLFDGDTIDELIDPRLGNFYSEDEVLCMLQAASLCIKRDPYLRPCPKAISASLLDLITHSEKAVLSGSDCSSISLSPPDGAKMCIYEGGAMAEGFWQMDDRSSYVFVARQAAASYWLAFGIQIPNVTTVTLISVHTLLSVLSAIFVFLRSFLATLLFLRSFFATLLGLKASKSFFNKFKDSVFNAPMVFLTLLPLDEFLQGQASSDITTKYAQGYYQPTTRELMRINGTTKAPVKNYASETSIGVASIRAFIYLTVSCLRRVGWPVSFLCIDADGYQSVFDKMLRYRPKAPLVLKGITCTFKEGTQVGIVGRTGSGKTTLITALFRLVKPDSGKILIDGLNICSIGLFRGSIRTNLDPLGLHSDDEIWKVM